MEAGEMKKTLLLFVFLIPFSTAWALSGSPDAGKAKSGTCVACHSADGNSVSPIWPKIAGQHEAYLVKQLFEYRKGADGARNNPVMYGIVQALTDQDIYDLASYYATQENSSGNARSDLFELGERIYRGGNLQTGVTACIACHGPKGLGNNPAGFPALSGQHAQYLKDQLHAFKEGKRQNDMAGMMRLVVGRMSDAEIEAVSSYIEGLH